MSRNTKSRVRKGLVCISSRDESKDCLRAWLQVLQQSLIWCCCLPLISAVLPKDFTFIPPRLLIVGSVYHTSSLLTTSLYILVDTSFLPLHSPVPFILHCLHTYTFSSSLSLFIFSSLLIDMNTRPPIATTNRLQALSVTFNQDYSCFSVGLDNGFCGALVLKLCRSS